MRIKSIRIENFRSFRDETIALNPHSCLVGPNGSGKSSVLSALNVFFREQTDSTTDTAKLTDEDYFLQPEVSYKVTDDLGVALGANIFGGRRESTFFGQFEKNDNVFVSARYDF